MKSSKKPSKKDAKKSSKVKSKKKEEKLVESLVTDIMPFKRFYRDIPVRRDGMLWEVLQITCKDLLNATQAELEFDYMCFDKLYRTFSTDLKIIGMNFPSDTSQQQEYIRHKIENTTNEVFLKELQDKLAELEWINKNLTDREYYLIFFSKDYDDYRDNLVIIQRALCSGPIPLYKHVDAQKKERVLFKYFNKNSFI